MIRPGEIVADHASRQFKVYPREARRLKDAIVARGRSRPTLVDALNDVSFRVEPGSAVGLVGRNGSGKTTLLRLLSGIIRPTAGHVDVGGRVGSLLELGAGFHPDLSGRENVFLNGSIHGLKRAYVREQLDEIVAFAGLEEFIDLPVRTYSSGMYMRLGFAIAAHIDADILLLDEVFAVGDEQFQRTRSGPIRHAGRRSSTRRSTAKPTARLHPRSSSRFLRRSGSDRRRSAGCCSGSRCCGWRRRPSYRCSG